MHTHTHIYCNYLKIFHSTNCFNIYHSGSLVLSPPNLLCFKINVFYLKRLYQFIRSFVGESFVYVRITQRRGNPLGRGLSGRNRQVLETVLLDPTIPKLGRTLLYRSTNVKEYTVGPEMGLITLRILVQRETDQNKGRYFFLLRKLSKERDMVGYLRGCLTSLSSVLRKNQEIHLIYQQSLG